MLHNSAIKMTKSMDGEANESKAGHKSGDETEHEPGMRVGEEYQAVIPTTVLSDFTEENAKPEPVQVWAPCESVADPKLDEYLKTSKDKHGYNMEQALGMLYWHKYNIDRSLEDLQNFTPLPDEWSMEDKVIFEQSFSSYGKSFAKIRAQLPDKSVGSLVKYYYSWKKIRNRTSLMDRQARRLSAQKHQNNFSAAFSDDESDAPDDDTSDSDFEPEKESASRVNNGRMKTNASSHHQPTSIMAPDASRMAGLSGDVCVGCSLRATHLHRSPKGLLCQQCFQFWRQTNAMRPKVTILQGNNPTQPYKGIQGKVKKKAPKGMVLTQEGLIAVSHHMHGDGHVRPLEVDLINLRRQIQTRKQDLTEQKQALYGTSDNYRLPDMSTKVNLRWTNEELLMAVQCVRQYGKDFEAMSEVLSNKNVSQCNNFFVNYRRRFNLHDVLEEYEKEHSLPRSDKSVDGWESVVDDPMIGNENDAPPSPSNGNAVVHDTASISNGVSAQQTSVLIKRSPSVSPPVAGGSPSSVITSATPAYPPPLIKPGNTAQSG